jgi:hypothetical protein
MQDNEVMQEIYQNWEEDNGEYWRGIAAGELAGFAYRYYGKDDTGQLPGTWGTAYREGFSDGFAAGYWAQARYEREQYWAQARYEREHGGEDEINHDTMREQTGLGA